MSGLVLGQPGVYKLTATAQWQGNSSGGRAVILEVKRVIDGVLTTLATVDPRIAANPTGRTVMQAVYTHIAEAGDTVHFTIRQSSGGALEIQSGGTTLQIERPSQ